jgi:hypothetical protein
LKFDITNDVNLEAHKYPSYGYQLIIWIRYITHEDCPS